LGAVQTPNEYENALGEKRTAIPMGAREGHPQATTGVEPGFTIHTDALLQIKAITAAEIEAKQHEDEAAAAAAKKKRQEDEAAAAAAAKERKEEEAKLDRVRRALLSSTLKQCRKAPSKHKRAQFEKRAKKKYGSATSR
jgi:ABC-type nitrate/sulfonate/bicarbonate transport system substrate-binding protein